MNARLFASIACALLLVTLPPWTFADQLKVRYPSIQHTFYAKRDIYFVTLLNMALARSGEPYELIPVEFSEYSERRSALLIHADQYDVHWLNTTPRWERELLPVRIPLYKGAIGWRVMLIKPEMQPAFDKVHTIDDLKRYIFVQGHDWADVPVLLGAGLAVERTPSWEGRFKMVTLDRAHAFPRAIVEAHSELQATPAEGLAIERSLILQYPAAYYYFVAPNNSRLQAALERGLKVSLQDGSFDNWFFINFGQQLQQLNLSDRTIIHLDNPLLTPDNEHLWFSIEWFEKIKARQSAFEQ